MDQTDQLVHYPCIYIYPSQIPVLYYFYPPEFDHGCISMKTTHSTWSDFYHPESQSVLYDILSEDRSKDI